MTALSQGTWMSVLRARLRKVEELSEKMERQLSERNIGLAYDTAREINVLAKMELPDDRDCESSKWSG